MSPPFPLYWIICVRPHNSKDYRFCLNITGFFLPSTSKILFCIIIEIAILLPDCYDKSIMMEAPNGTAQVTNMDKGLSIHPDFFPVFRFTLPTIIMMVFMALYTVVDGIFLSQWVNTDALAAVNIVGPFLYTVIAFGNMFGAGGSAVVAHKLGAGAPETARRYFTALLILSGSTGAILSVLAFVFQGGLLQLLGASPLLLPYCRAYFTALLPFIPFGLIQTFFHYFFVTAGKPQIGMAVALAAGFTKIALEYLFIAILGWGVFGAALATGIGYTVPSVFAISYFTLQKKTDLRIAPPLFRARIIGRSMANGASEMISVMAGSLAVFVFNLTMIERVGEDGVAAISILLYSQNLWTALYIGFSNGVAPLLSYTLGTQDGKRLRRLFVQCIRSITLFSVATYVISLLSANNFFTIFAPPGSPVFRLASEGFPFFAISYIFIGFNIFSSAFFTSLGNARVSATISFLRTFVFLLGALLLLPSFLGMNGIWFAVSAAELLTFPFSLFFFFKYRSIYHYSLYSKATQRQHTKV